MGRPQRGPGQATNEGSLLAFSWRGCAPHDERGIRVRVWLWLWLIHRVSSDSAEDGQELEEDKAQPCSWLGKWRRILEKLLLQDWVCEGWAGSLDPARSSEEQWRDGLTVELEGSRVSCCWVGGSKGFRCDQSRAWEIGNRAVDYL